MTIEARRDNLFRGMRQAPKVRAEADEPHAFIDEDGDELCDVCGLPEGEHEAPADDRAAMPGDSSLMVGYFAVFDQWTEVDSVFEGRFMERVVPGAFRKTISQNRSQIKVQFDHGYDFHINDALLGPIDELAEKDEGVYYEVPLLDTDYNRDRILPMLQGRTMSGESRGSLLGASFQFRIVQDEWNDKAKASAYNPEALPERTIKEVRLYEFGPVVWPAYEGASSGVRSLTDHFEARRLARMGTAARAAQLLAPTASGIGATNHDEPAPSHSATRRSLVGAITETTRLRRSPA